uniref:Putative guanine nucleotide exchange factor for rho and rac gtpase n=1 Tax=Culex tarsalis TaxID=7177 RepID=A0A1Q3FJR2_CULTA
MSSSHNSRLTIKTNRISRNSGICVEDGTQSNSSSSTLPSRASIAGVKKRFPAGGGGGRGGRGRSYVSRLTQHFENLTCSGTAGSDESGHCSPIPAYHSEWDLRQVQRSNREEPEKGEGIVRSASVGQSEEGQGGEGGGLVREEKMDDAVHVIENIYEEVLVKKRVSAKLGVRRVKTAKIASVECKEEDDDGGGGKAGEGDRHQLGSGNHLDEGAADKQASDKISDEQSVSEPVERNFELAEEATEALAPPVAEARNTFVAHEEVSGRYYDDDEFDTDTDSFDSTDDDHDEVAAVQSSSRPGSDTSIKSERITNIMKELLDNEENYVNTLGKGIEDYVSVMHQKDLPMALRGQRYHIFGNIEKIYQFHREIFLPRLRENRASIAGIAETFIKFIESDRFYCYILFALNRPKSEKICNKNLEFFQERQHAVEDKLGLNSFLLQPIQRLPRYKLLLAEVNKEVLKLIADSLLDSVKDEIGVLCKAEKRLEKFIDVVNEAMSINDIQECYEDSYSMQADLISSFSVALSPLFNPAVEPHPVLILRAHSNKNQDKNKPLNLFHQGKFRKMFEVDIYDWDRRRRYPGKMFFFEKCIIYTEKIKEYLEYRGHYEDSEVGLYNDGKSRVCVFARKRGIQEVEISGSDIGSVQKLAGYIEEVMKSFAMQERNRVKTINRNKDLRYEQRVPSVMTINRGSVASTKSTFSVASNGSRDSYESTSQTTWDPDNPVQSLITAQKHFCQILAANRKYYFNQLPDGLAEKIRTFINVYDQLVDVHSKRVYEDFAQAGVGIDELCELFILYFQESLFDIYNDYLKHFKKAADIMKNIHRASRTSISSTLVAQTTDDFTFLALEMWNKYQNFIQTQIVRMSEQMNSDSNAGTDKELFRKLAFVEVQITTFRKTLMQNYRLFNLDESLSVASHGLVVYSERVRFGNETISNHRILICEKAAICVRIQLAKEVDRQVEKFNRVVFVDKFVRGVPAAKLSKKSEIRLNFELNGNKHPVDFGTKASKDKFFGNYCMVYQKLYRG